MLARAMPRQEKVQKFERRNMNAVKLRIAAALTAILVLSVSGSQRVSAQEHIDNLISRFIDSNGGTISYRSVVKRNPSTHEIEKRVVELSVSNKELGRQLIAAFEAEKGTADGMEINRVSPSYYTATLVWSSPRRIYELSVSGSWVSFSAVTNYGQ